MTFFFSFVKFKEFFDYELTSEQASALETLTTFLNSADPRSILLFKGYAGTGKTSILSAVVRLIHDSGGKTVLLAPTGRAAKVFSEYSGCTAFTIHKKIYRMKRFADETPHFVLAENLHKNSIFIVDEASMIANDNINSSIAFGSGQLLYDLVSYVYEGENCRLILVGDDAQLPPVSCTESPALNIKNLNNLGFNVAEIQLSQVVRQQQDSGILFNATLLRNTLKYNIFPALSLHSFSDIKLINGDEIVEELTSAYSRSGIDDTIVICRSNKTAGIYNNGIRNRILCYEEVISSGDRLMAVKNNYSLQDDKNNDYIANGEIIQVRRVRQTTEAYGFRFCNIAAQFSDHDIITEIKIILDVLASDTAALTKQQNDILFKAVMEDYADVSLLTERIKKVKKDPFLNALQVKYAYAITCHKAQGGQWKDVFIDAGYITKDMFDESFCRWLYTAFTRATQRLFLVNWRYENLKQK